MYLWNHLIIFLPDYDLIQKAKEILNIVETEFYGPPETMRQYWLPLKVLKKYTVMQVINEDHIANTPSIVSRI